MLSKDNTSDITPFISLIENMRESLIIASQQPIQFFSIICINLFYLLI